MYLIVILMPFLSYLSTNLLGRFIGIYGCCFLATTSIFVSFFLSIYVFFEVVISGSPCTIFFAD
jgi:hypothetical protein